MRDAPGEESDAFHLLRLDELFFEPLPVGDVLNHSNHADQPGVPVRHGEHARTDHPLGTCQRHLLLCRPRVDRHRRDVDDLSAVHGRKALRQAGVLEQPGMEDVEASKDLFLVGGAEETHPCLVHVKEVPLRIHHHDGKRRLVEDPVQVVARFENLLLEALLFRDVARDALDADHAALLEDRLFVDFQQQGTAVGMVHLAQVGGRGNAVAQGALGVLADLLVDGIRGEGFAVVCLPVLRARVP